MIINYLYKYFINNLVTTFYKIMIASSFTKIWFYLEADKILNILIFFITVC